MTTPTLPDPDSPLSERVPAKAIKLANAEVKQSKQLSHGLRPPRGCCSLHYNGNLDLVFRYSCCFAKVLLLAHRLPVA